MGYAVLYAIFAQTTKNTDNTTLTHSAKNNWINSIDVYNLHLAPFNYNHMK